MPVQCPACHTTDSDDFPFSSHVDSPKDREYFKTRKFPAKFLKCVSCLSLFQDPWPSVDETREFYQTNYQNYGKSNVPLLPLLLNKWESLAAKKFVKSFRGNAHILDFGCGTGSFLNNLFDYGCTHLTGFDFSYNRLEQECENGISYFNNLVELKNSNKSFQVIRMNHTIEHLTDVDDTLYLLGSMLNSGGVIVGQTPNATHYTASLFNGYWGPLHFPYHTVLFSEKGLKKSAEKAGLELVNVSKTVQPTGWAMSLENIFKELSGSKKQGRTFPYVFIMLFCMPMVILDYLLPWNKTGVINFALRKI